MSIILPHDRPAIDVVGGSYPAPEAPWAHLDQPDVRARVEPAIAAVGRLGRGGDSGLSFLGTAFAVGPDLLLCATFGQIEQIIAAGDRPVVDFGRELQSADSPQAHVQVQVDDLVWADPDTGLELLHAELPDSIVPLRLSDRAPAGLADRDVVLIGYPGIDGREGDAALLNRIFRGVLGVKRLLPGRSRGADRFPTIGSPLTDRVALAHDCSSTAGCGGAPLLDVETGEVLGVHLVGLRLQANYAVPAPAVAELVERRITRSLPPADLSPGSFPIPPPLRPPPTTPGSAPTRIDESPPPTTVATALSAYDEADALGSDRPALLAPHWDDQVAGPWAPVMQARAAQLDQALRALGKVRPNVDQPAWNGGAFVVGNRLALTASHCAQVFADGAGAAVTIKPEHTPAVDFSDVLGLPAGTASARITKVRFIHPCFHVALLELAELPLGVGLLELASQLPSGLSGRLVTLLAFNGERGGGLYLQPGKALQIGELPDSSRLPALVHDCASGGGSSGGPVIDLDTGYVIGVHTHKKPGTGGFAQCAWELARDPHVWEHEISFRPDPRPSWLSAWDIPDARPSAPVMPPPPANGRWTVDKVPIDWSLPEPRALELLLTGSVEAQFARFLAENAGVPLGTINFAVAPIFLWREILKTASVAGVLRRLLEEIAGAPQHAGIADKLRVYL